MASASTITNQGIKDSMYSIEIIAKDLEGGKQNVDPSVEEAAVATWLTIKGIGKGTRMKFQCGSKTMYADITMELPYVHSFEVTKNGGVQFEQYWDYKVDNKYGYGDNIIYECIIEDLDEMFTRVTPKGVKVAISNAPEGKQRRLWGFLKRIITIDRFFDAGVRA